MYFIFHPANGFIYCSPNFADVVIGAFYFSHMVFFLAICCGKQVIFQDRNTKKKLSYIFIGSV